MRVILLTNIQVNEGLTNGAIGIITACTESTVTVKFNEHERCINRCNMGNVSQIPLRMAYGMTACKVQGQDIKHFVRVDGKGMYSSEIYTSLSRCQSRDQLKFRSITPTMFESMKPHHFQSIIREIDIFKQQPTYWNPPENQYLRISYAIIKYLNQQPGQHFLMLHTAFIRESHLIIIIAENPLTKELLKQYYQIGLNYNKQIVIRKNKYIIYGAHSLSVNYQKNHYHYKLKENLTFTLQIGCYSQTSTNFQLQFPLPLQENSPALLHNATIKKRLTKPIDILGIASLETIDIDINPVLIILNTPLSSNKRKSEHFPLNSTCKRLKHK